jgi:hypothetical protein
MARGKKPAGRPSKLTPDREALILDALRAGNYRETVARYVGIGVSTLYGWLERGEADLEQHEQREAEGHDPGELTIYAEFSEAVTRAEAEAEVHAVTTLQSAMKDDWRAAAEYLQRRHNKRWSRADRLDVEVDQTVHGAVSVDLVPDDERRAEVARLLAAYGGDAE